jgi:hypothetical protein
MKESSRLLVIVLLNLVWVLATIFALANNSIVIEDSISVFMSSMSFIALFGSLFLYSYQLRNEQKR